ncbi:MAG: isocitrate/isopropylmalate family dehydrogenase, partial [Alphaproteobacteria bacterium]|nr:isocitrate/isopropylmalate family dehydrogenase [Alphaproteobacteria bacterium]
DFDHQEIGLAALEKTGTTLPDAVMEKARTADGIILGPVSHLDYPDPKEGGINVSGFIRSNLDLYANIRPARTRANLPSPTGKAMDLVIVRENTEGFYADRSMYRGMGEMMPSPDMALAVRKITAQASLRIAEEAFKYAVGRRRKVTAVHKANVLRVSDGLFLDQVRKVAAGHADIEYEEVLVDAMAAHLIRDPGRYDVIVTTNMYGDILSDEASELAGGLGLAGSLNAGDDHGVAQAQHGSAPDIAGKGIANPTSLILSAAMLLNWLGQRHGDTALNQAAALIDAAVDDCLDDPATRTTDLGGSLSTQDYADAVAEGITVSSPAA